MANTKIDKKGIKDLIIDQCSPRHVPDHIIRVPEIPYTLSGKKVEIPIKLLFLGKSINKLITLGSLRNPDSIKWFVEYAKNKSFI